MVLVCGGIFFVVGSDVVFVLFGLEFKLVYCLLDLGGVDVGKELICLELRFVY